MMYRKVRNQFKWNGHIDILSYSLCVCVCTHQQWWWWRLSRFSIHIRINFSRSKLRIAFKTHHSEKIQKKNCGALHSFINISENRCDTASPRFNRWIEKKKTKQIEWRTIFVSVFTTIEFPFFLLKRAAYLSLLSHNMCVMYAPLIRCWWSL